MNDHFVKSLTDASETVSRWPAWKQDILGIRVYGRGDLQMQCWDGSGRPFAVRGYSAGAMHDLAEQHGAVRIVGLHGEVYCRALGAFIQVPRKLGESKP